MNAEKRWTPGPWTAKWSKYAEGVFLVQAGMPSNRVLARFDGDGDGPDDEEIASASLISAAPDMAEALTQFVSHYPHGINPWLDDAVNAARAALRKAGAL